jgi:choline dehydrogenase-like flavoprotein
MSQPSYIPESPEQSEWDAIVIGTGMGGSVAGYELARLGRRVLFIEKGLQRHDLQSQAKFPDDTELLEEEETERLRGGHWPTRFLAKTSVGSLDIPGPIGCGSGGSTALYAAALERFSPGDFEPRQNFPKVPDSTLPERWPVSYGEFSPFYDRAERMFGVTGTADRLGIDKGANLREPPKLSPRDVHLADSFAKLGLHPYRIHAAFDFLENCSGCVYGLCERQCRKDAGWVCLMPALRELGASMLPRCEALRIEASATSVSGVHCRYQGREIFLRGRTVVVAAGAYNTPVLLQNSGSAEWPDGLANRSGWVGRNLMFHISDLFAVTSLVRASSNGPQKTLAFNDFYHSDGEKLGTFQTIGVPVSIGHIMQHIRDLAEREPNSWKRLASANPRWWGKLTSPVIRGVALAAYYAFNMRNAAIWSSIIEDLPYLENRVFADANAPSGLRFEYHYRDELRARVHSFRKRLKQALAPHRAFLLTGDGHINLAHVCGTCRFGEDPASSVLDADCRAHGVRNLFVADSSFFPSSGGTNPSLTIAANALRVAGIIDAQLRV